MLNNILGPATKPSSASNFTRLALGILLSSVILNANATGLASDFTTPQILANPKVQNETFLPDFSYAGYHHGEKQPDTSGHRVIDVAQHGIIANDGLDDSQALLALLVEIRSDNVPTVLQFGSGRYIISSIIYFDRNNLVIRGEGTGTKGTEFYFPRPLMYSIAPELAELNEYLLTLNKIQKERANNINIPFTEWSWSGGYFWTRIKDARVKKYLDSYDTPMSSLAKPISGKQGAKQLTVDRTDSVKVGDIVELQWFNATGDVNDQLLKDLYADKVSNIGSHHWSFNNLAIARQQVEIVNISGKTLTFRSPLLHDVTNKHLVNLSMWEHLTEIGFEHFSMNFGFAQRIAHHVEQGFNGIYLTRLYNGWIDDVRITNADSGVLLEAVANISVKNVTTDGDKLAHYSVQMGAAHNVLSDKLHVKNIVVHPLSFNTFSTKSVYVNAVIDQQPFLDQHSGVNQQNLFDHIKVSVDLDDKNQYKLFAGGGASYWKPSHAAYNTFWNIQVHFNNGVQSDDPVTLNGMVDGPLARLIGISANRPIKIDYQPEPYIEGENLYYRSVPSLYYYQLEKRLTKKQ